MKTGIVSIIINEKMDLDVRFEGEDSFLLPLMGSLTVVGDFLKEKLLRKNAVGKNWKESEPGNDSQNEYIEEEIGKQEAISFYLSQREKIEQRLQIIAQSDKRAKFSVNKKLFSKL